MDPRGAAGVDFATIEAGPLVGIAEQRIGRGNLLETLSYRFVARMKVGVQLLGELAINPLYIFLGCVPVYLENGVGILHRPLVCVNAGPVVPRLSPPTYVAPQCG